MTPARPRLALPFTVIAAPGVVRLVAGEDHRYTLRADGIDRWLPALIDRLDGRKLDEALAPLAEAERASAGGLLERLASERVLVEATALDAHRREALALEVEGRGPLVDRLRSAPLPPSSICSSANGAARSAGGGDSRLLVLAQDRLDPEEALGWNRRARASGRPSLWVTHGPLARGFVSPLFLPDAGPCLACLLARFRALSPVPELHDVLLDHARAGGAIAPSPFPDHGLAVLASLVLWKRELAALEAPPSALYRLHVLEAATLEVSSHPTRRDPSCPEHA
jgi:bacteriocin biosynthesis cyclodehydratase domain-containing protein